MDTNRIRGSGGCGYSRQVLVLNIAAGSVGLVVQVAVFVVVALSVGRTGAWSRAVVAGGVTAVYGYALVVAAGALLGLRWQILNGVLLLGLFALLLLSRRLRAAVAEGRRDLAPAVRRTTAGLVLAGLALAFHAGVAVLKPELSIDGQLYHGPILAQLVRTGSLWGWTAPNQYMYYTDLTMAGGVNLASFTGTAVFDDALQVPHLLLLAAIVNAALARRFRSPFVRMSFAALMMTAPVIWVQARILYVDLAYGTAVAGVLLLVILTRRYAALDVVVIGVLLGAVFATKPTGILTGIVLLVLAVVVIAMRSSRARSGRRTAGLLLAGVGIPLVAATAFYVRNLVQFGNPVYPVTLALGPLKLPGIIDLSVFTSLDGGNGGIIDPSRWLIYVGSIGLGMTHGVVKPDYDPRAGGYGFMPLALLALVIALVVVQLVVRARTPQVERGMHGPWRAQLGIVGVVAIIVAIQPASYDTRYMIGPTIALGVAALLTAISTTPRWVDLVAGTLALVFALAQAGWTEWKVYPGLKTVAEIAHSRDADQPPTPGDIWGRNPSVAWLPGDGRCVTVVLQTNGGVTASGMSEDSPFGTLPYALYGAALCNQVVPITLKGGVSRAERAEARAADYLVVYATSANVWQRNLPGCLRRIATVPASGDLTRVEVVLKNSCSADGVN